MTGSYAKGTSVSASKTRDEIERTLSRYGASAFMYGWDQTRAIIQFQASGRQVRFILPLPDPDDDAFAYTPTGFVRSDSVKQKAYDEEVRRRWRALALGIKAKLEMVETGIVDFEREFLAHVVLPNGQVVGDWLQPQLEATYEGGQMPKALPGMPE